MHKSAPTKLCQTGANMDCHPKGYWVIVSHDYNILDVSVISTRPRVNGIVEQVASRVMMGQETLQYGETDQKLDCVTPNTVA